GQETKNVDAGVEEIPGALSGTYFCDDDRDGVDDGATSGDADVTGMTVMLFEADGTTPATDIDGNPVAAVQTDSQGNYRFDNLAAGQYVVMFETPAVGNNAEGKAFIAPNVGDNGTTDAVDDSDVIDAANGKTAPVTVVAGQETKNVDAGVEKVNNDPDPQDDSAEVCYDDVAMIDVLANDSDADADTLNIVEITGAGADGVLGTADDVSAAISVGQSI
ncbi:MAG: SdrD B-like domain-containing protein, partial [Pseudomonadota bacterium]